MSNNEGLISYRIDKLDNIDSVNSEWDRFALSNDAPEMVAGKILNRNLWDFVSGITLEHLYRQVLGRVRAGKTVRFDFRCDAPGERRFLSMKISPEEDGGVFFETRPVRIEKRAHQELFRRGRYTGDDPVVACSWCNKIQVGGDLWLEIEDGIKALGIFGAEPVPYLTHGICQRCCDKISATLRS